MMRLYDMWLTYSPATHPLRAILAKASRSMLSRYIAAPGIAAPFLAQDSSMTKNTQL